MVRGKDRPRFVAIFFAIYMGLVLFQTSFHHLGTYLTLGIMLLTIISGWSWARRNSFRVKENQTLLFVFILYAFLITTIYGDRIANESRFFAQIVFCIFLTNISITEKEYVLIKNTYMYSMVVYSLFVIRSIRADVGRFTHSNVELLGSSFDPNFLGLPLVIAMIFLLSEILDRKHVVINLLSLGLLFRTIILLSSRGCLVGLLVPSAIILLIKLKDRSFGAKLVTLIVVAGLVLLLIRSVSSGYENELTRLTNVEGDNVDNGRLGLWSYGFSMWLEHPLFGNGLMGFFSRTHMAIHNTYVQILCGMGLFGMTLFLIFIIRILCRSFKYDKVLFCGMISLFFQILFLDALDSRVLWAFLCFVTMLPNKRRMVEPKIM